MLTCIPEKNDEKTSKKYPTGKRVVKTKVKIDIIWERPLPPPPLPNCKITPAFNSAKQNTQLFYHNYRHHFTNFSFPYWFYMDDFISQRTMRGMFKILQLITNARNILCGIAASNFAFYNFSFNIFHI